MTLAAHIEQDIQAHILAGRELPFRLTLAAMSKHYEVSPMPVRKAVDALVQQGFLSKEENGRLLISPETPEGAENVPVPVRRPPDDTERQIMELAIGLSLQGQETYLREESTAEQFGIGRTVLRRIFSRLSGAGVLEHVPRCGWQVCAFREEDMKAFVEIREVMECKAIDLARGKLEPERMAELIEGNTPQDGEARLDDTLHAYWIERSGNRYLRDFFRFHGAYYRTLFNYAVAAESVVATMAEQHREILETLVAENWRTAKKLLRQHIRNQQPTVLSLIASYRQDPEKLVIE